MISLFETSESLRRSWPSAYTFQCLSLSFASCYVYSPRASGRVAELSRLLCSRLKAGDSTWLPRYAGCVHEVTCRDAQLAALFAGGAVLVPVPGSRACDGPPSAAQRLALALNGLGLGGEVWLALRRQIGVRKSATSALGERPSVREHYESFALARPLRPAAKILLVDDVITKGRTLLAAAARLQTELPHADIRAFALVRTLGFVPQMERVLELCHGVVRWAGGDARREP
jgi:predicted amidophosphoribosyltransferase